MIMTGVHTVVIQSSWTEHILE